MVKVLTLSSKVEAHLAAQFLIENGIHCEIVGSKDYSSHILGGDIGRYDLMVAEEALSLTQELLSQREGNTAELVSQREDKSAELVDSESQLAPIKTDGLERSTIHLKKAIIFAVCGVIFLPIIFNLYSIYNLLKYRRAELKSEPRLLYTSLVIALQIPAIFIFVYLLRSYAN